MARVVVVDAEIRTSIVNDAPPIKCVAQVAARGTACPNRRHLYRHEKAGRPRRLLISQIKENMVKPLGLPHCFTHMFQVIGHFDFF
jgi:hypothetical protein